MSEEIKEQVEQTTPEMSAVDYIGQINEIKSNMVSKEKYERILADNKRLADTIANGSFDEPKEEVHPEVEELEKNLLTRGQTSLDLWTKILTLRDERMRIDPSDDILAVDRSKPESYTQAEALADAMREIVEESNGNPNIFESRMPKF